MTTRSTASTTRADPPPGARQPPDDDPARPPGRDVASGPRPGGLRMLGDGAPACAGDACAVPTTGGW